MRVLLLSAYDAGSHRYWREALQSLFSHWHWQVLALPPRHFSWRVRGNALQWGLREKLVLEADYDLLIATSMTDLATLRGLVPALGRLPTLLYFHENQFDYPVGDHRHGLLEAQMVSLYAALAADRVVFNSAYNRDSFLAGLGALLRRLPDFTPPETLELITRRSSVLPVPLQLPGRSEVADGGLWRVSGCPGQRPLRLLWSGRLEHDKGGDILESVLHHLERLGCDYELAITGQTFRRRPAAFERIGANFGTRLAHMGWLDKRDDYHRLLAGADLVLSTALHEFQGIAVMEAVLAGCVPVLPDRLAFREFYPRRFLYASHPENPECEARAAAELVVSSAAGLCNGTLEAPDLRSLTAPALAPAYEALMQLAMLARDGGHR